MQDALSQEKISEERNGVKIVLNGNMEVLSLTLNPNLNQEAQEDTVKKCINDAIKQTQRVMAKKMQEMGGFPGMN